MSKTIWDRFAPIYSFAMKSQKKIYDYMYSHIRDIVRDKTVLELATGPGLIAKHVADVTEKMIATDFSPDMIRQAKKGKNPGNLLFEIADASNLQYEDSFFDVVIIANCLHIVPNPEKVLSEIERVLKPSGILVAPNFIRAEGLIPRPSGAKPGVLNPTAIPYENTIPRCSAAGLVIERKISKPNFWQKLLDRFGVKFEHQWTAEQYTAFLEANGWKINKSEVVPGRIDLIYVECKK